MSLNHLKKQAKNLQSLYPEFVAKHSSIAPRLADFQELVAKTHGYPSFHAAQTRLASAAESTKPSGTVKFSVNRLELRESSMVLTEYKADGEAKMPREYVIVEFQSTFPDSLNLVTEHLDDADFNDDTDPKICATQIELCRELVRQEAGFVDGFAHWANALFRLGRYREVVDLMEPVVRDLFSLLSPNFRGRLMYHSYQNRPVFRAAHVLVLAYWELDESKKAIALAKKMLKLWPNDNIGFRFLLEKA